MNVGQPSPFQKRGPTDFRCQLKEVAKNTPQALVYYEGGSFKIELTQHSLAEREVAVATPPSQGSKLPSDTVKAFTEYVQSTFAPEVAREILANAALGQSIQARDMDQILIEAEQKQEAYILSKYFSAAWDDVFANLLGPIDNSKNKTLVAAMKKNLAESLADWENWLGGPLTNEEAEAIVYEELFDFMDGVMDRIPVKAGELIGTEATGLIDMGLARMDEAQLARAIDNYQQLVERGAGGLNFQISEAVNMVMTSLQEEYFMSASAGDHLMMAQDNVKYLKFLGDRCTKDINSLTKALKDRSLSPEDRSQKEDELAMLRFQLNKIYQCIILAEDKISRYEEIQAGAAAIEASVKPITVGEARVGYHIRMKAYFNLMDKMIADAKGNPEKIEKLEKIRDGVLGLHVEMSKRLEQETFSKENSDAFDVAQVKSDLENIRETFETYITTSLKAEGLKVPSLKRRYEDAMVQTLEEDQLWAKVSNNIKIILGDTSGKTGNFTVEVIPHGHLPSLGAKLKEDGKNGVTSLDTTSKHAVNMAVTRLSVTDKEGKQETLFEAVRSGIASAFGIGSRKDREAANMQRGREQVQAAAQLAVDRRIREDAEFAGLVSAMVNNEERASLGATPAVVLPTPLQMASVSLVTPDTGRGWFQSSWKAVVGKVKSLSGKSVKEFSNNERAQLQEQVAVWDQLQKQETPHEFTVEVKNAAGQPQSLRVIVPAKNLQIRSFNFGVNEGAVQGKFGVPSNWSLVSGWDFSDKINNESLDGPEGLLAEGEQWLANHDGPGDVEKSTSIRMLLDQIQQMRKDQSYKNDKNPYKFAVRVAALAHLMGYTDLFNCKSGKDRTGMMDVEIKFLFAYMNLHNGQVPNPTADLTHLEKGAITALAFQGGNREIQQYNTGLPGSKTKFGKVDALVDRFIDGIARTFHQGVASAVKD